MDRSKALDVAPASPEFTIVTVCRNCSGQIERTMRSVLGQDFRDFEYIVIDGASTDGTYEIVQRYSDKLAYSCSEPDGGIYFAMNKGIECARGRWILFMNAGDEFASADVLSHAHSYSSRDDFDIIYGDMIVDAGEGKMLLKEALEPANRHRMYFCHQSAFVRTEIMKRMPFDTGYRLSGDFCFFKRCFLEGYRFKHIGRPYAIYDCGGVSTANRLSVLSENIEIIRRFDSLIDRMLMLPRLLFVIYWNRLRGKS